MKKRVIAVKELIENQGWPPRWVAEKISVSIPTVYRWLKGEVKSVTEKHLTQLALLSSQRVEYSIDRTEIQFVEDSKEIKEETKYPIGFLECIDKRIIRNQLNSNKYNKSDTELFFEGENILEKIYTLKMEDYRIIKQLIERLSKKEM